MRTIVLIKIVILLAMLQAPAWAYHKWYDENGMVHFSQDDPPANAKNEDGSSWWAEDPDLDDEKEARKQRIKQARQKLKITKASEHHSDGEPAPAVHEDLAVGNDEGLTLKTQAEELAEDSEPDQDKGFFERIAAIFSKDEQDETVDEKGERVCEEPWLLEEYGICALTKPDMDTAGNTFTAEVIDNRKGVWSDCRGTYNGDIVTFKYKGEGYWETDGNVPQCSFYQGFYWK